MGLSYVILVIAFVNVASAGDKSNAVLDVIGKIYSTVEEANAPDAACFEFYSDKNYEGTKHKICARSGKCIRLPEHVAESLSSIKFLSDGRFFTVQKLYLYKMDDCKLIRDQDGYDTYGSHTTIWNDGYHNCDGFNLNDSQCDQSFNDSALAFSF
ncbi:ORF128 [Alphabaculovirus altermyunipunctae]|jgi:hypothetical protein|uniref:ORF128 n=1 Tax=Mythimna unipuncta nucleopolyhedrovirus TaxID=447897 RepID=A0A346TPR4_9ABAC|nr:ORF128 [Mythimna unipuncta nucleopolyhedrovirus]AXU41574.1 ORF128 [Mythimna unipuncta nucleopolyhedrovirus]